MSAIVKFSQKISCADASAVKKHSNRRSVSAARAAATSGAAAGVATSHRRRVGGASLWRRIAPARRSDDVIVALEPSFGEIDVVRMLLAVF